MEWLQNITSSTVGFVILVGALGYALHLIWVHIIRPAVRILKAFSVFVEAQPTLLEIAEQFKPNGGESLRDKVNDLQTGQDKILNVAENNTLRLNNIEQQLETSVAGFAVWDGSDRRGNNTLG